MAGAADLHKRADKSADRSTCQAVMKAVYIHNMGLYTGKRHA